MRQPLTSSEYIRGGLDALLTKPVMLKDLKLWLREAVNRRSPTSAPDVATEELAN